jgi:DNA-binding NarL/FixJ family response regulator
MFSNKTDMNQSEPIRVAIVEDDEKIRSSLVVLIEGTHGFRCVGGYEDAEAALRDLPRKNPDVVLADINLPGMQGTELVRAIRKEHRDMQFIMLTVYEDTHKIFDSLAAGAIGYLLKMTPPDEILSAIRDVRTGGSPMSPQIARKVVQSFHKKSASHRDDGEAQLTKREEEILLLLSKGFLYKEIADQLFISPDTVHNHIRHIYEKLQVHSRTEAVVKYLKK